MMKTFVKSSTIAGALLCSILFFTACSHDDDPTPSARPQGTVNTELKMTKTGFAYFSFAKNQMVDEKTAEVAGTKDWDIAFDMLNGRTNNGAVYVTRYTDFEAVKTVKPFLEEGVKNEWLTDRKMSVMSLRSMPPVTVEKICNPAFTEWYTMQGMTLSVKPAVYIVRTADGHYVKLQFTNHRGANGDLGNIQFKYAYIDETGINALAPGEFIAENLEAGKLTGVLKSSNVKELRYLTIKSGNINDEDLDTLKRIKTLEVLDISGATLKLSDESTGLKDFRYIKKLIAPANLQTIAGAWPWFNYMSNLEEAVFPGNSLENIQAEGFTGLPKLRKITLPSSVLTIGEGAFQGAGLEEFTFPEKVQIISKHCLMSCKKLKKVVIPASVKEIKAGAFLYDKALKEIVFKGTTPPQKATKPYDAFSDITFDNADGSVFLHFIVPKGTINAYIKAWGWEEADKKYFKEATDNP